MEINIGEIKEIAETLPIGYYAKRRITVEFNKEEQTSSYSPLEDKITFAFNNIVTALKNVNEMDKEVAIRSVLYHETSHAILTPSFNFYAQRSAYPTWANIFEDERIETLLKNYYMNTDFNALLNAISPYNGEKIQNAVQAFFILCRYRIGKKEFLEEVENIIRQYAFISAINNDGWRDESDYWDAVYNLWNAVQKDFKDNPQDYEDGNFDSYTKPSSCPKTSITQTESDEKKGISKKDKMKIDTSKNCKSSEKVSKQIDGSKAQMSADGENEADGVDGADGTNNTNENNDRVTNENPQDGSEDEINGRGGLGGKIFTTAMQSVVDNSLTEKLATIISIFNKKNSSGNGATGHSGILNPRNCGNEDYRFFDRKLETRGNNRFGSLHLNLFIDTSGSFYPNKSVVNKLIVALTNIEQKNPNFSLDIVHCECGEELKEKNERLINPCGGNRVDSYFAELFRKLQKPMTFNYNIILFDGDCMPNNENVFNCADRNNVTVISDPANKWIFSKLHNAKVIITQNYSEELYDNVFASLQKAFR